MEAGLRRPGYLRQAYAALVDGLLPPQHALGLIRLAVNHEPNELGQCHRRIFRAPRNFRSHRFWVTQALPASSEFAQDCFSVCLLALGSPSSARRLRRSYPIDRAEEPSLPKSKDSFSGAVGDRPLLHVRVDLLEGGSDMRRYYASPVLSYVGPDAASPARPVHPCGRLFSIVPRLLAHFSWRWEGGIATGLRRLFSPRRRYRAYRYSFPALGGDRLREEWGMAPFSRGASAGRWRRSVTGGDFAFLAAAVEDSDRAATVESNAQKEAAGRLRFESGMAARPSLGFGLNPVRQLARPPFPYVSPFSSIHSDSPPIWQIYRGYKEVGIFMRRVGQMAIG